MSDINVDASGLCTFVHILLGSQLWLIAREDCEPNSNGYEDVAKMKWQAVWLNAHDEL